MDYDPAGFAPQNQADLDLHALPSQTRQPLVARSPLRLRDGRVVNWPCLRNFGTQQKRTIGLIRWLFFDAHPADENTPKQLLNGCR